MEDSRAIKLTGDLAQTTTRIQITEVGDLVVDYYDFSDDAHRAFGNDVAYVLTITATEKSRIFQLLAAEQGIETPLLSPDNLILRLLKQQFGNYFQLKQWLDDNAIQYQQHFDSWA